MKQSDETQRYTINNSVTRSFCGHPWDICGHCLNFWASEPALILKFGFGVFEALEVVNCCGILLLLHWGCRYGCLVGIRNSMFYFYVFTYFKLKTRWLTLRFPVAETKATNLFKPNVSNTNVGTFVFIAVLLLFVKKVTKNMLKIQNKQLFIFKIESDIHQTSLVHQ